MVSNNSKSGNCLLNYKVETEAKNRLIPTYKPQPIASKLSEILSPKKDNTDRIQIFYEKLDKQIQVKKGKNKKLNKPPISVNQITYNSPMMPGGIIEYLRETQTKQLTNGVQSQIIV